MCHSFVLIRSVKSYLTMGEPLKTNFSNPQTWKKLYKSLACEQQKRKRKSKIVKSSKSEDFVLLLWNKH